MTMKEEDQFEQDADRLHTMYGRAEDEDETATTTRLSVRAAPEAVPGSVREMQRVVTAQYAELRAQDSRIRMLESQLNTVRRGLAAVERGHQQHEIELRNKIDRRSYQ